MTDGNQEAIEKCEDREVRVRRDGKEAPGNHGDGDREAEQATRITMAECTQPWGMLGNVIDGLVRDAKGVRTFAPFDAPPADPLNVATGIVLLCASAGQAGLTNVGDMVCHVLERLRSGVDQQGAMRCATCGQAAGFEHDPALHIAIRNLRHGPSAWPDLMAGKDWDEA